MLSRSAWPRFSLRSVMIGVAILSVVMSWIANDGRARGPIRTGNEFDLAIFGRGYFAVSGLHATQVLYVRRGSFAPGGNGNLCLRSPYDRFELIPPIVIPTDYKTVRVDPAGTFWVSQGLAPIEIALGQIPLTTFINESALSEVLPGVFEETSSSGPPCSSLPGENGAGMLMQHWLEAPRDQLLWRPELPSVFETVALLLIGWLIAEVAALKSSLSASLTQQTESARVSTPCAPPP